ncbi:MAG: cobalamin B12-binding domain-containing protein [bacterium]|nr:cobalamin B12-binding domain-containing protein [bacterium]
MNKKLIGASIGSCIHVGGLLSFLKLAEEQGYQSIYLGTALSVKEISDAIKFHHPDIVAISYRLTPEVAAKLFNDLKKEIKLNRFTAIKFILGGTPAVTKVATQTQLFDKTFNGTESLTDIQNYLKGIVSKPKKETYAATLGERIQRQYPYPLIRHHFGLPSLKDTIKGARMIAQAKVLDVLSIGPDQNAQEYFFHQDKMDKTQDGAGGVPLRKPDDLTRIYQATRCGNYPLVRCYAGTNDLIKWAKMSVQTIHNAWGAIPLFWYSVLDGRSKRTLLDAIQENQDTIQWYAVHNIPVEINDSHQWSLRGSPDVIAVTVAYLSAYNAKQLGVKQYIAQYMFNTPPQTSPTMDFAKMLAKKELIEGLVDKQFAVFTQVRAGLASLSPYPNIAKGQLAASAVLSLSLKPHILHVVGYSEGDHAIQPEELIESCEIVHGAINHSLKDYPTLMLDKKVQYRKQELIREVTVLLDAISELAPVSVKHPLSDVKVLTKAVSIGLLDAPNLHGNPVAKGTILTKIIDGKCVAIDPQMGKFLSEAARIKRLNLIS